MNDKPEQAQRDDPATQAEQRSALLRRVAVAGGMIAMLIGALAVFDANRRPPAPVAQGVPEAPVVAAVEAPAPPLPPAEETPVEAFPVEADTVSLQEVPPPLPEGTALPEAPPAAGPSPTATPAAATVAPLPRAAAPASAPAVPAIARTPAPQAEPVHGYVVQVGVFSNVANAEEVRSRLALKGIPSQIEARVQVGPFKSRVEADRARARLRAIGFDSAPPSPARAPAVRP